MTSVDGSNGAAPTRRWLSRGYLVTMGTVVALAGGLGLTVLGLGSADQAVASFDAASWVWSKAKGEVARINGVTAKVDTRVDVQRARGHQLEVSQSDRFVILRDVTTGVIGSMDLTTLQEFGKASSGAGLGVRVALKDSAAFVIDTVQGQVQQLDPRTLGPIGQALHFSPGITGGVFDGQGRLWIAAPSEGTITSITPAPLPSGAAAGNDGAGGGSVADEDAGANTAAAPRIVTKSVAEPSHDLTLSTLSDGVAVLNRTTDTLTTIRDDRERSVTLTLAGPGALAAQTDGRSVPVTVADTRHVYVVDDQTGVHSDFTVPGSGTDLEPAVAWQGYYYVADSATGQVHVFDAAGRAQNPIAFANPGGPLELEVREGYLFINAPGSSTARVVDDAHQVRTVDKYADDVLGGDRPPTPPPPPAPPKPTVGKPGAPNNVRAAAGNAQATVTWQAANPNGASITRYVVVGAGRTFKAGAKQRSLTVTGLTNGETYQFAVHAVNRKGDGPARTSNPVRPTAEVPDAPTAVSAAAKADGTVVVSWPAANGQGRKIKQYAVTAISEAGNAPAGDTKGTSLTIASGKLEYGTRYAFRVVAINDRGAGSKPSPVSASVVPYTKPDKPADLEAATVGDEAGAINVAWTAPAENGRAITKYVVTANGTSRDVTETSVKLTGLGSGANVVVEVRAVNEAGSSDPARTTARTVAKPKVTITGINPVWNAAAISFTVDAGGGVPKCKASAPGGSTASGACSRLTVKNLKPGTKYTFTVTATNVAGSTTATRTATTAKLYGTAYCKNGAEGDTAHYCDREISGRRNGNEIFKVTRQDDNRQAGWVPTGTKLQAFCKKRGEEVYAYIYNHNKKSTWWIRVAYEGRNYIPWAWLNFSSDKKTLNALPKC